MSIIICLTFSIIVNLILAFKLYKEKCKSDELEEAVYYNRLLREDSDRKLKELTTK